MNLSLKRAALLIVPLGLLGALSYPFLHRNENGATTYRKAAVKRGDIQVSISATGTVEPEELVDVGAQVAGKILSFGTDVTGKVVDYGSQVEKGTVLAHIDDALFSADAAQTEAQLAQAKASLQRAEADLVQLQAKLEQAVREWNRARKLGPSEALSQSAYDSALSAHEVALANVSVGKASVAQSRSAVAQAEATLRKARQNLEYCTIKSPVDGVIIDRRVNIGQTVVASLNAPSLFLIAKDLRRLQVWVAVNEADIGNIHMDQPVLFTVDAFPGESFQGRVGKTRLNATLTQNVVTYIVEVNTDNSSGRLLPYLTANVRFIVNERRDVLLAPNAALRYTPSTQPMEPAGRSGGGVSTPSTPAAPGRSRDDSKAFATLWVVQGGSLKPLKVRTGITDGAWTEIEGEGIEAGLEIVTGEQLQAADSGAPATVNPFTPKIPGRSGSGGSGSGGRPGGAGQH